MGNFNNNLIAKWRERFEVMVRLTLGIPIILAGLQLALVGNQLSFDLTKLATWTNTEKVFALPLGAFALLAAVTSLIGLYHRSMLLNKQLEKVQEQIAISNKQFKRSEEQFKLAQEQFALASRKENYVLYLEHSKRIREGLEEKVEDGSVYLSSKEKSLGRINIEFNKFYGICFPENSHQAVNAFGYEASDTYFEKQFREYQAQLEELIPLVIERSIRIDDLFKSLNRPLFDVGISYLPNQEPKDNDQICQLILESFKSLQYIYVLLLHYALVEEQTYESCTDLCVKLEDAYLNS